MASTQFKTDTITLSAKNTDFMSDTGKVIFSTNVLNAGAAIQAWNLQFEESKFTRYHLKQVAAEVSNITYSAGNSPEVSFNIKLTLGEIEPHHYEIKGSITVLVIAECE